MNKQTEHGAGSAHLRKAAERTINGALSPDRPRPRHAAALRAGDHAGRERLRHQVASLVIAPPAATFLAGDGLNPPYQRSLRMDSIGASAASSPISSPSARRP
jgi:hypothetical protein